MSTPAQTLAQLVGGIVAGGIRVVDLTVPLEPATPIINLPPPFANSKPFALQEISRYDERGPGWYWNNFTSGEHTGTHFDAPNHWVTGKDGSDVADVPVGRLKIGEPIFVRILIQKLLDTLDGRHGKMVVALGANLVVLIHLLTKERGAASIAAHEETFRNSF